MIIILEISLLFCSISHSRTLSSFLRLPTKGTHAYQDQPGTLAHRNRGRWRIFVIALSTMVVAGSNKLSRSFFFYRTAKSYLSSKTRDTRIDICMYDFSRKVGGEIFQQFFDSIEKFSKHASTPVTCTYVCIYIYIIFLFARYVRRVNSSQNLGGLLTDDECDDRIEIFSHTYTRVS